MTLPPLVVLAAMLLILVLLFAYIGATTRADTLQATVDRLWPFVDALGSAFQQVGGAVESEAKAKGPDVAG